MYVDEVVPLAISGLKENVEPYVLESSPDVLSIGRRCVELGYKFVWEPFSYEPYFITNYGDIVKLVSVNNVPYLCDQFNVTSNSYNLSELDVTGARNGVAPAVEDDTVDVGGAHDLE